MTAVIEAMDLRRAGDETISQPLIPFAAVFRLANGDPGVTGASYGPALVSASGTADWASYVQPGWQMRKKFNEVRVSDAGDAGLFGRYLALIGAPTSTTPHAEFEEAVALRSGLDTERDVAVILPPRRVYNVALRALHMGRAAPLIDPDDFTIESDAG